jgi:bifunctional UDP-N-acetylglucosamine pyrophosphorylase/glucosamine-1-phosphate N-acetyltransferase
MSGNILAVVFASKGRTEDKPGKLETPHPLLGKSMLQLALDSVTSLKPEKIYIVKEDEKEEIPEAGITGRVHPITARGTQASIADVILSQKNVLTRHKGKDILILDARYPLLRPGSLRSFLHHHRKEKNVLTRMSADIRNSGQRSRGEAGMGVYVFRIRGLLEALDDFSRRRKTQLSLSSLLQAIVRDEEKAGIFKCRRPEETVALHTPGDVASAVRILRDRKIRELEAKGVIVLDPGSTWIDLDVNIGRGTVLYPSVVIEGHSRLGKECRVYPFVYLINTRVGDRVKILSSTMIEESVIEDEAQVGPFTHFRPKTVLRSKAKVGNFVEMKNTVFGERSKAGHLSYIGDSIVKEDVNIGAGTITCNYDGLKKYQTIIEQGAFIGSGTELVAPVKVGRGSYIGAGSTITKDVSPEALAVARSRQIEKPGWARKRMKK